MKFFLKIFTIIGLAFILSSCAHKSESVETPTGFIPQSLTDADIKEAIIRACGEYNWVIEQKTDGLIRARQTTKKYFATVDIKYNKDTYSVNLVDASGMLYNKSNNEIHGHYNFWARNLAREIDKQFKIKLSLK